MSRAMQLLLAGHLVCALLFVSAAVKAQHLRDPTLPPAPVAPMDAPAPAELSGIEPNAITVIVRNGKPHVVVNTRLYAQGDPLGNAHIERISDTGVWLREGGKVRKISQFTGIERRTVTPVPSPESPSFP